MTYVHGQDLSDCGKTGGDTQESSIQKTLRRLGKDERTGGPEVRRSGCTSHRTLNPAQGLERGRRGGEVKVMTCIPRQPKGKKNHQCRDTNETF